MTFLHFFLLFLFLQTSVKGNCVMSGNHQIDCDLRLLDFRKNSSDVPSESSNVKILNVDCSDTFFFESQLRSDHFGDLPQLKELNINYCKIRQLPPRSFVSLTHLETLSIHTHNSDWTSLHLQPDYESLVGLSRLVSLDLSLNNLRYLPSGLFCSLASLQNLNVSHNNISDLKALGLGIETPCEILFQSLIVSHCRLSSVTPGALNGLSSLLFLDLSSNHIRVLSQNAFQSLTYLQNLNLANNQLVALPPNIFFSLTSLKLLQLSNNSLGTIDHSVFSQLPTLETLELNSNSLDENWIKSGIFNGLKTLIFLNLSSNYISKLDFDLFIDLKSLKALNLKGNQLTCLSSQTFTSLNNLESLNLSHNRLEVIQQQCFDSLSKLSSLFLDHNKIHSLHGKSFKNCSHLKEIKLNHNLLTEVPTSIHQLGSLQNLDLSSNLIGVLKRESLQGLPSLESLALSNNEISRIGENSFAETPQLANLDLSQNRFKDLDQETFQSIKNLQSLNLAENQLDDINGILKTQLNLQWLNVSSNNLGWFDYAFIPPSLEWLDLHDNRIDSIGNYYSLKNDYSLKYMDASYNRIQSIESLSVLSSIQILILHHNAISNLAPSSFLGKKNLTRVDLNNNKLNSLNPKSLLFSTTPFYKVSPILTLGNNPLVCDCHLQWLQSLKDRSDYYPKVEDINEINCSVQRNSHYAVIKPLANIENDEFICPYESHCFNDCNCCDFFACDCQMKCPKGCNCFHDSTWTTNVIQCSSQSLNEPPSLVSLDATSIHLDGNNFTELRAGMFLGRSQRIRQIFLNNSKISFIRNQSFEGLPLLSLLDLSSNELKKLYGWEFIELTSSLKQLYLQNNQLVFIGAQTFRDLLYLEILRLDGNLLISYPIWTLEHNHNLKVIALAHNWWQCDCNYVKQFKAFINAHNEKIIDASSIGCTNSESNSDTCSDLIFHSNSNQNNSSQLENKSKWILVISGSVILLVVLFSFLLIIFLRLRNSFRIWLHAKYGIRFCSKNSRHIKLEDYRDKIFFDSIIMYALKDALFVNENVRKILEPTYKCVYHQRDLSGIYTSEGFKSALSASSNHLVLISKNFIESEWENARSINFNNVIIIMIEDLISYPDDFKKFLKLAKKVLYFHEGPVFWRKLRYYMTDPLFSSPREGGAELTKPGMWSFDTHIEATTPMLANLISSSDFSTPMKKPLNGILDSNFPNSSNLSSPVRSCGTNFHQRSRSALVPQCPSQILHLRSHSYQFPPTPPPKIRTTSFTTVIPKDEHQRSTSLLVDTFSTREKCKHIRSASSHVLSNEINYRSQSLIQHQWNTSLTSENPSRSSGFVL